MLKKSLSYLVILPLFASACSRITSTPATKPTEPTTEDIAEGTSTTAPTTVEAPAPTATFLAVPTEDFSRFWIVQDDTRTGVRFAIPCFWTAQVPPPQQDPGGLGSFSIRNYDYEFAMSFPRSIDGLWESGAIKIDMGYLEGETWGIPPGTSMLDFVTQLYSQDSESKLSAIEEFQINGQPALLVTTESTFGPGQFYLFQVDEETFLLFSTRIEVMQNPDVQAILNSIAIHPDVQVNLPVIMPGEPPEGLEAPCLGNSAQTENEPIVEELLDCAEIKEGTLEWVTCNVQDGIRSRNLSALHSFMADPFTIGYWGSESRAAPPPEVTAELLQYRLPPFTSSPHLFTADRSRFPALEGQPPETMFGPDVNIVEVVYSEGWGLDGQGTALLFFTQDEQGKYQWYGMGIAEKGFEN